MKLLIIAVLLSGALCLDIPDLPRQLKITVDGNLVDICVDGIKVPQLDIPNHSDVTRADTISIPDTASVVAVKINNGNPNHVGFVASDNNGLVVTNSSWRCHVNANPDQEWCEKDFDASGWNNAVEIALYGQDTVGYIAGNVFSPSAYWIWTSEDPGNNGIIYCRGAIAGSPSTPVVTEPPVIVAGSGLSDGSSGSGSSGGSGSGDGSSGSGSSDGSGSSGGSGSISTTITKIVGEHVTIYAIASGATSQSSWSKDNAEVSSAPAIHIDAVQLSDAGVYVIAFSNSAGTTTFQTTLVVLEPPALSGSGSETYRLNIDVAVLFTNVDVTAGIPAPTVTWYKDGVLVSGPPSTASLADAGTYVVIAENVAGTAAHYAILSVIPPIYEFGPSSPSPYTRIDGTATSIFCSIHGGDPCDRPTVSWTKDGEAFNGNDGEIVFFPSVDYSDAGTYVCSYVDRNGRSLSKAIQLDVVGPAVIAEPTLEEVWTNGGRNVCLSCPLVSGTQPVSQSLYRDGQLESGVDEYCASYVDYSDIGTYACVQGNTVGDDIKISALNMSVLVYTVSTNDWQLTSLTTPTFLFQMKANGPITFAFSATLPPFTNNNVYYVTLGANGNTATTVSKPVGGKIKTTSMTYNTPGVLTTGELSWYWVSSPAPGQLFIGTGPVIGDDLILNYVDSSILKVTPAYVAVRDENGSAGVIVIYP